MMIRRGAAGWMLVTLAICVLLAHAWFYLPFFSDDALISLRYADRLLAGDGLTWTDGRPVEGYSNLLWVLLVALAGALGADLVLAARVLGVVGMVAVVAWVGWFYLVRRRENGAFVGAAVGLLFFVSAGPTAVWAIGGLEQPLVAAALAGVFPLYWLAADRDFSDRRLALSLSALLAVLCLTRPDGPIFTVAVLASAALAHFTTARRWSWTFALVVVSLPVLSYGGQLIFRLAYYGEWVPNTALVKLDPSLDYAFGGLRYVARGTFSLAPASILATLAIVLGLVRRTTRSRFLPLATVGALWTVYLVVIGGDIFPAHRHFVPLVVVMTYALAESSRVLWAQRKRSYVAALSLAVVLTAAFQFVQPQNRLVLEERWEWQGRSLALTLKDAFAEQQPLLAVTAAGALPYWSGFPALDMLGLNDYYLPRHQTPAAGFGAPGHGLGDGAYVLRRAPDLIVFHIGYEPTFRYAQDFAEDDGFASAYMPVRVRTATPPVYNALVWFNVHSEKLGIDRTPERVYVPAYFFNAFEHTTAYLHGDHLVVAIDEEHPAGIVFPDLIGAWDAEVIGPRPEVVSATVGASGDTLRVTLTTESSKPLEVEAVVLTPLDPAATLQHGESGL